MVLYLSVSLLWFGSYSGYPGVPLQGVNGLVDIMDDGRVFDTGDLSGGDGIERGSSFWHYAVSVSVCICMCSV